MTPGGDGDIPLTTTGLTAGILQPDPTAGGVVGHSGSSAEGDKFSYTVDVPAGARYARFDLDTTDNAADLDLTVYQLDAAGTPIAAFQSATGSADERVNLRAPDAGSYRVEVAVYAAPAPTTFDLRTYAVVDGGAALTLTPPVLPGTQGVPATYTAAWAGLTAFSNYLGLVNYGDTGASTVVNVVTQADVKPGTPLNTVAPTIAGTPEVGQRLTAAPGTWDVAGLKFAYRWQANGADIPGATRANYRVATADQGKALTVMVTATRGSLPPGTATSAAVTVKFASATSLALSSAVLFSWQQTTATVKVTSGATTLPAGKVVITLNGRSLTEVAVAAGSSGTVSYQLPKNSKGKYSVRASFVPTGDTVAGSTSQTKRFVVIR